jgi:hypothetical protein
MACEEEPPYEAQSEKFRMVHNPKQVLALLLKSYHYLSDDFLQRAAPALGMDVDKLRGMVDEIRNHRLAEEEKIRMFRERVYCQFYRCIAFEKRLISLPPGSGMREKMRAKAERARKRLRSMRKTLAGMKVEASNWQIAHVMGVSKGTVDSNLYTLMSRYKEASN